MPFSTKVIVAGGQLAEGFNMENAANKRPNIDQEAVASEVPTEMKNTPAYPKLAEDLSEFERARLSSKTWSMEQD